MSPASLFATRDKQYFFLGLTFRAKEGWIWMRIQGKKDGFGFTGLNMKIEHVEWLDLTSWPPVRTCVSVCLYISPGWQSNSLPPVKAQSVQFHNKTLDNAPQ